MPSTNSLTNPRSVARAILDTNAIDYISDHGLYEAIETRVSSGELELLWTHITIDELAAISDLERRQHLLLIGASLARVVATGASVFGYSRINFSRLSNDQVPFEEFRKGNLKNTADALITATAIYEDCPICTLDQRMIGRANAQGVPHISPEALC